MSFVSSYNIISCHHLTLIPRIKKKNQKNQIKKVLNSPPVWSSYSFQSLSHWWEECHQVPWVSIVTALQFLVNISPSFVLLTKMRPLSSCSGLINEDAQVIIQVDSMDDFPASITSCHVDTNSLDGSGCNLRSAWEVCHSYTHCLIRMPVESKVLMNMSYGPLKLQIGNHP